MNERLNELAIQAGGVWRGGYVEHPNGDSVYTDKKYVSGCDMDVEQFTQLIVQECMEVCRRGKYDGRDDMSLIQFNNGIRFCMNAIDNHFGD